MSTTTRKEASPLNSPSAPSGKTESVLCRAPAKQLLAALQPLGSVAVPRSPRPILSHLRLSVSKRRLEATATDLDMWLTAELPLSEAVGEGEFAVPAEPFLGLLREIGEVEVTVSRKAGEAVTVVFGRNQFTFECLPAQDFPPCSECPEGATWTMAGGALPRLLKGTSFAAARERTRYTLNGVHFEAGGDVVEVVATDGRRLALARAKAKVHGKGRGILPLRAAALVAQMGEDLEVTLGERALGIRTKPAKTEQGTHRLVTRLLEGQYPDYPKVIPKDHPNEASAEVGALLTHFRWASQPTRESRAVRLQFAKGSLTMTGGDPGVSSAHLEMDLDYRGEAVDLRLNPDFVLEGLKTWGGARARWQLRDSVSPCVLFDGEDHLYVVLPITLE